MPALLISFGAQPLPLSLEASGYYDTDGNWVEDYTYYDSSYDPSYSTGGYYDEFGNWISDGSGYGDTGSTGSSYDIWLSPSSEIDTDNDGISDYDEVYGYSIETESYYEVPYSYEEYNSETGEYVWRDSSYTSTTYNSIWVTTDPTDPDTDGDGLPDGWERLFSFHPNDPSDGYEDDDGDGLRNGLEYILGTDLWNPDTDEDGLTDGEEVLLFGTDPLNRHDPGTAPPTNGSETGGTGTGTGGTGTGTETGGTDSGGTSTGGNGLTPDWLTWQGEHFADLLAVNPDDPEAAGDGDPDNDELTNIEEFLLGTDPRNPDTDGDDLLDGWEVAGLVLHFDRSETPTPTAAPLPGESGFSGFVYGPYQFQSSSTLYDDDALTEIGVVETWMRTVETHDETWGITATTQETMERTGLYNAEGTLVFPDDGWIVNESGGLVPNTPVTTGPPEPTWTQYFNDEMQMWVGTLTNGSTVSTWWWVHTDPLDDDSDGDDMPDGWEYENWLNPKKASDAAEDPDDDTLPNLLEYLNGTDPWLSDTDGDELSDSHELNVTLTDPLDPADPGEDSGGTTPIGGGITTVTRYQAFGSSGGSSGGGAGGGSVLTMSGGGLLLGSQQSGLGNRLQPGNGGQKQTSQPVSEDELYLEVRRVSLSYGPTGGEGIDGGGDGAHDGYWNEVTDPVTNEMTLREWVQTGGGTDGANGTGPDEPAEYAAESSRRIGGQVQQSESEPSSTTSPAITFLEKSEMESPVDWDSDVAYRASSGHGVSFTSLKKKENPKQENRGSGELVEVRLARKTAPNGTHLAVERDVEKTYLKVFKSRPAPFDEADEWTIDKVEVVNLKIQERDSTSVKDKENPVPDAVLKPEIVEGKVTGVSLLPVEFVALEEDTTGGGFEPSKVVTSELKFSKLERSIDSNDRMDFNESFPDDYFYVRIPSGKDLGKTSVWISTTKRDGTELDAATEIELDVEQGTNNLISKPLILVADQWDDRYAGNAFAADNTLNDQTHLAELGGEVIVKSIKPKDGEKTDMDLRAQLPIKKELDLVVKVFSDATNYGGGTITTDEVKEGIETHVRRYFYQVGIWINDVTPIPIEPSELLGSKSDINYFNSAPPYTAFDSTIEVMVDEHGDGSADDLTVFFCRNVRRHPTGNVVNGAALYPKIIAQYQGLGAGYANNAFIDTSSQNASFRTVAHEIGHILTNNHHYGDTYPVPTPEAHLIRHNLMKEGGTLLLDAIKLGTAKRIYESQETPILQSPLLTDPENE